METFLRAGLHQGRHHGSEGDLWSRGHLHLCELRAATGVRGPGRQVPLMRTGSGGRSCQGWDLAEGRPLLNQREWPDTSWQLLGAARHLQPRASWQVRKSEENRAFLKLFPRTTSLDIWGDEEWQRQAAACSSRPVKALQVGGGGGQERAFVPKCHFPALRPELSMFQAP